jgi:hypothetical protein
MHNIYCIMLWLMASLLLLSPLCHSNAREVAREQEKLIEDVNKVQHTQF